MRLIWRELRGTKTVIKSRWRCYLLGIKLQAKLKNQLKARIGLSVAFEIPLLS